MRTHYPLYTECLMELIRTARISRQIWKEGSFDNTSCFPLRLQDKVLGALPTAQHCWSALCFPWSLPQRSKATAGFSWGFSPACTHATAEIGAECGPVSSSQCLQGGGVTQCQAAPRVSACTDGSAFMEGKKMSILVRNSHKGVLLFYKHHRKDNKVQ